MHSDKDQLNTEPTSGSVGEHLHEAKETTVSGASVAVLVLWTIAVAGWTGFQVRADSLDTEWVKKDCSL